MTVKVRDSETVKEGPAAGYGVGRELLAFAEVLLLGVWLGAMAFFSFAVAPSAFAVLPSHHLAGQIVTSTITKVEILGLMLGPLIILIQLATWRARNSANWAKAFGLFLVIVMTLMAALSRFWLSPQMIALRAQMGGMIDDVPQSDPLRLRFNDLHHYSVALMGTALIAGLIALFFSVRSWLRR